MKEDLINFETAKLARKAGFDEACAKQFFEDGCLTNSHYATVKNSDIDYGCVATACTQAFLQKWFREKHSINIFVGFRPNVKKWDSHFYSQLLSGKEYVKEQTMKKYLSQDTFDTYELALEDGLQRALKSLIKT